MLKSVFSVCLEPSPSPPYFSFPACQEIRWNLYSGPRPVLGQATCLESQALVLQNQKD